MLQGKVHPVAGQPASAASAHREDSEANVMQRISHWLVDSVCQLCGHAMHILEARAEQYELPSIPQQRELQAGECIRENTAGQVGSWAWQPACSGQAGLRGHVMSAVSERA